jgi:hypothetical protein
MAQAVVLGVRLVGMRSPTPRHGDSIDPMLIRAPARCGGLAQRLVGGWGTGATHITLS